MLSGPQVIRKDHQSGRLACPRPDLLPKPYEERGQATLPDLSLFSTV